MTIGASLFCLAAGAVLTFAIETDSTEGINVNNVGIILMVIGAIGLALYALVWGPRTRRPVSHTTVIEERQVVEPVVQVHERVVADPVVPAVPSRRPVVERRIYE